MQTFGRKKNSVAVAFVKRGRGLLKINGKPIELVEPEILRYKVFEPVLLLGKERFAGIDVRVRVRGGGHTSQTYAIRQAIAKAIVAWTQKYIDESTKQEVKEILLSYDRTLLVADPRRCEAKKYGGRGARARFRTLRSVRLLVLRRATPRSAAPHCTTPHAHRRRAPRPSRCSPASLCPVEGGSALTEAQRPRSPLHNAALLQRSRTVKRRLAAASRAYARRRRRACALPDGLG